MSKSIMKFMVIFMAVIMLGMNGCKKKEAADQKPVAPAPTKNKQVLNIYNWVNYVAPETVSDFTAATGIEVNYKTYRSNEEMQQELEKSEPGTYDLIFPSDYMVQILQKANMLDTLDLKQISSYYKVHTKFRNPPYDPENRYSIAYSWGTSGLAYRSDKIDKATVEKSWRFIFEPNSAYYGKLSLLDDMRETMGIALKYLGYSANSANPDEIGKARDLLLKAAPLMNRRTPVPSKPLVDGDVWIAHMWSGDAAVARETDEISRTRVGYFLPQEGSVIFIDNMCIPVGAKNKEAAYEFINFVLLGSNALKIVKAVLQPLTSHEVYDLMAADKQTQGLLESEAIFPPNEILEKCEYLQDVGDAEKLYREAWEQVTQKIPTR